MGGKKKSCCVFLFIDSAAKFAKLFQGRIADIREVISCLHKSLKMTTEKSFKINTSQRRMEHLQNTFDLSYSATDICTNIKPQYKYYFSLLCYCWSSVADPVVHSISILSHLISSKQLERCIHKVLLKRR